MKIGNVDIKNNIFLAPMAGVTDVCFRLLCKEQGCGLVYSEMVSAKGILYNSKNTQALLETDEKEHPVAVQLFGSRPLILGDIVKRIDNYPIDIIDINMGCPAPKIVKNNEGSALMKNPKLIGEIVESVSNATKKPVTVKIRKGFDDENINAVEIAKTAEYNGAKAITIHPRTREQYYSGKADWNIIKEIKESVSIPVIGNGDVTSPEKAKELFEFTNCDAVMVGRAAQGDPWIFKRITAYINNKEIISMPSIDEKIEMIERHLEMLIKYKGEYIGIREMRKHIGWYIKSMPHSAETRVLINKAENKQQIIDILYNMKNYKSKI